MGAGIFYGQLARFINITNSIQDLEERVTQMLQTFLKQGYLRESLLSKFLMFVQQNKARIGWLGLHSNLEIVQFVDRIFQR